MVCWFSAKMYLIMQDNGRTNKINKKEAKRDDFSDDDVKYRNSVALLLMSIIRSNFFMKLSFLMWKANKLAKLRV